MPLEVIADQLMEVKGWRPHTARNKAQAVTRLGKPENREHLDCLLNGEISFAIALLRSTPTAPRPRRTEYRDEESATKHIQDGFKIMLELHKNWKGKQYLIWFTNLCKPLIPTNTNKS